jgi:hypothetical protein
MTRDRGPYRANGTVWLVADKTTDTFNCYWYGPGDGLAEQARSATEVSAVAWGRARSDRVRLRAVNHRTYWAGSAARPAGITYTWQPPTTTDRVAPLPNNKEAFGC